MDDRPTRRLARGTSRRPPPVMTERQLEAYFIARDTLRRVQRSAVHRAVPPSGADGASRNSSPQERS
jgi:hypothetical protein